MMSVIKDDRNDAPTRRSPWRFILLVGVTNLFADMTYEGARGVTGDFSWQARRKRLDRRIRGRRRRTRWLRGAFGLRDNSRPDRSPLDRCVGRLHHQHAMCPALALAGTWPVAAGLMIGERLGR